MGSNGEALAGAPPDPRRLGRYRGLGARFGHLRSEMLSPERAEELDTLGQVRLQSVGAGVVASAVVLGVLLVYAIVPGHEPISRAPYFTLLGIAALSVVAVAGLPWRSMVARGQAVPALVIWAVGDAALVSVGIAFSGGSNSDLYLVYLVLGVFQAGVAYPPTARTTLGALLPVAYVSTLAATGWDIGTATVLIRASMILATAAVSDVLSMKLSGELFFHATATAESEERAQLWSRVAGLGRALSSLDEQSIVAWAVEAVNQLGFEAANLCLFVEGGTRYRVLHPIGLPPSYASSAPHPADRGMPALVRRQRSTVVVDDYRALPDVIPELRDEEFRHVVATPVWVDGEMAGVLVGGTRGDHPVGPEEMAAIELLAAHAGTGISNARKLEHQRRDAAHFRSLVQSAPDAMIVLDVHGSILEANHKVQTLFGYDPNELVGQPFESLVPQRLQGVVSGYQERFRADPRTMVLGDMDELCGVHRNGTEFPMEVVVGPIDAPDGLVVTAAIRDVTERREFERRLAHQASHDDLTGLPNRALFVERLAHALQRSSPSGPSVAVCFLDVDHFKYVNDSRGHSVGDALLAEVATRISSTARASDVVARFGGDEFAVLVEGLSERPDATAYAWRLLAALDRPFLLNGVECYVSASVGIAFGGSGDDAHDLLRDADAAMYHAKQRGRARVEVFDEVLTHRALERVETEASLHQALLGNELSLVYQPYVDLRSGTVVGVEALLRWHHPHRGNVPPSAFMPIAEESGLVVQIGRWVLSQACHQAAGWVRGRPESSRLAISVNVSNRQLEHDHLIAEVAAALETSGLPPECLVLEITESFFIRDLPAAVRRLHALRRLGVRIAIDDFGTGFSSLNSLSRLPIDLVKIDKSFVDGLGTRYDSVIGAVVDVAEAFDLTVVAEGVEQPEQLERLKALGCHMAQGFLLGTPATAEAIESKLALAS